ncbi:MAG TPA: GFA family protein [Gaiellaceae bacterium]|nr:GFA family protein [Gaiellaceae bacterium]
MMRRASCSCGQLHLEAEGEPVRISMCHCLACQRRTGSAFGMQARFPKERVRIEGRSTEYVRISDEGEPRAFNFCPECGSTVYYQTDPELIAVPIGAFADPGFPPPKVSVYESRRHPWVTVPDGAERLD